MSQDYTPGDFLIFQIEAGFGLLRLLSVEENDGDKIWHLSAFNEMFLDIDDADRAIQEPGSLTVCREHMALTNRAFEATQTARMENMPLTVEEVRPLDEWRGSSEREVSDLSVRLLLGLR